MSCELQVVSTVAFWLFILVVMFIITRIQRRFTVYKIFGAEQAAKRDNRKRKGGGRA